MQCSIQEPSDKQPPEDSAYKNKRKLHGNDHSVQQGLAAVFGPFGHGKLTQGQQQGILRELNEGLRIDPNHHGHDQTQGQCDGKAR